MLTIFRDVITPTINKNNKTEVTMKKAILLCCLFIGVLMTQYSYSQSYGYTTPSNYYQGSGCGQDCCAPPDQQCGDCYCLCVKYEPKYYNVKKCCYVQKTYQVKHCRSVPKYYEKCRVRYVPQYYTETCCKYVPETYCTTECRSCPTYTCEKACKWVPKYYYKRVCNNPCQSSCQY